MTAPLFYTWDGDGMIPLVHFRKAADKQFVVGEKYRLVEENERSKASHDHYFASLHDAWLNLPEELASEYPTEMRLRKRALIATGFCDVRSFVCASKAEALRLAAWIVPKDDDALIDVRENTVREYTAQSQSRRAMGKEAFQKSKQAVLDWVAALIGVDAATLASQSSPSIAPTQRQRERVPA